MAGALFSIFCWEQESTELPLLLLLLLLLLLRALGYLADFALEFANKPKMQKTSQSQDFCEFLNPSKSSKHMAGALFSKFCWEQEFTEI